MKVKMGQPYRSGLLALVVVGILTGCADTQVSTSGSTTVTTRPPAVPSQPHSELVAVTSARWSSNVHISYPKSGAWTFASNGLPDSTLPTYYAVPTFVGPAIPTPGTARVVTSASLEQPRQVTFTLPVTPQYTAKATTTALGPIGVTVNGALFFNAYEANGSTVALASNFTVTQNGHTGVFVDGCNGHFTPAPSLVYHYHGLPGCIVRSLTRGKSTRSPTLLGFAFDGFGIYDNVAEGGGTVKPKALDACNGIFSPVPGYPHGIYHYVVLDVPNKQSSIGCYHGVVSSAYTDALRTEVSSGTGANGALNSPMSASVASLPPMPTAQSLAADPTMDVILIADLRRTGFDDWCG